MLLGAHISVSGGYEKALDYAFEVGCECAQIFAKSPRQWRGPAIDPHAAGAFREARARRGFGPIFTHTAYLINPATPDQALREKSIAALADELVRGSLLGAAGVVPHIGSDPDGTPGAAAARVAVCLDTCHAFAYGLPVDSADGWREVVDGIGACCGVDRLGLIHANDCLFERGSRRDRHAWIGDGFIGQDGFSAMVCVPELATICAITEMPGDVPTKDLENLRRLTVLRDACDES